jgi:hypothetical protein
LGKKFMKHCCQQMADAVSHKCAEHADPFDCPDCLISYTPKFDEYGIIVHDGGSSSVRIRFCPFCGTCLPESKRYLWFEKLEALGIDDPGDPDVPAVFQTDEWIRKPNGDR